MFKSYLKLAARNFARYKYLSLINAFGLAMGMSVSLLLISFYLYVSSFDDFHHQKENIYRITTVKENADNKEHFASAPSALLYKLSAEPGIKQMTRLHATLSSEVITDKMDIPVYGYYADSNFFSVFDFEMVQGNPVNALSKPNSIVLTESVARKFEASGNVLGNVLEMKGLGQFEVTGVIKDQRRSHFLFEALVSFSSLPADISGDNSTPDQWTHFNDQYLYVLTNQEDDHEMVQRSLDRITKDVNKLTSGAKVDFILQALGDITPGPDLENSIGPDSDNTLIIVFATICVLILLPACFNYANLSIARALKRSKEIGLRKTMGGNKSQLFIQFIVETIATVLVSLVIAILIFLFIRPGLENMMPGGWLDLSLTWPMVVLFLMFALVTGFLTGVFPAVYFSRLNPIQALKGTSHPKGFSRMPVRRLLIISQFALSFCFIVLLIVFSRQYQFNLNYDYGFETKDILDVELEQVNRAAFRTEFSRLESVNDLSMSSGILGLSFSNTFVHEANGIDSTKVFQLFCDSRYVNNMGLQLIAGQNFPDNHVADERYLIVNEEFLRIHRITHPLDALGKIFRVEGKELEVIGVLKNFHFAPLQVPIKSFFLRSDTSKYSYANLKISTHNLPTTLSSMEKTWSILSSRKLEAHLFDDEMEELYYKFYRSLLKMIGFLGLIAIAITLLGLLGMIIYTIEPRTKEVGVRKVFGASEAKITYLLSKDFIVLMVWAIAFAIPITMLVINDFLSALQYYRVSLNAWDIVFSLVIFLAIGLGATASQIRKVMKTNPVETLRHG